MRTGWKKQVARPSIARITETSKAKQLHPMEIADERLVEAKRNAVVAISGILLGDFDSSNCAFCKQCDYKLLRLAFILVKKETFYQLPQLPQPHLVEVVT